MLYLLIFSFAYLEQKHNINSRFSQYLTNSVTKSFSLVKIKRCAKVYKANEHHKKQGSQNNI